MKTNIGLFAIVIACLLALGCSSEDDKPETAPPVEPDPDPVVTEVCAPGEVILGAGAFVDQCQS